jgi:predicted MFS family arabinose efflux permease
MTGFVSGVGGILAALGFGMVAGTLLTAWRGRRLRPRLLIAIGLAGTGATLALFTRAVSFPALWAVAFVAGIFVAILLVTTEAAVQSAVGPEARGRVFALRDFSTRVAVLATAGLLGIALGRGWFPPAWAVAGAGALLLGTAVFMFAGETGKTFKDGDC